MNCTVGGVLVETPHDRSVAIDDLTLLRESEAFLVVKRALLDGGHGCWERLSAYIVASVVSALTGSGM